jgi:hypothetical protein
MNKFFYLFIFFFCLGAYAQLAVTVSPLKVAGQKTVVELSMTNEMTNGVKSARAICLLLDDKGKLVAQSTKWVIGENEKALKPKEEAKFNFVITSPKPVVASNVTAKVIFSRVIFDNGKSANPQQVVILAPAK